MSTKKVPKGSKIYECINCHYFTYRKSQFERHLSTDKHKKCHLSTEINQKVPKSSKNYICEKCDKQYKDRSGLWRHSKKCKVVKNESLNKIDAMNDTNNSDQKDLVMYLIKENKEIKNLMVDVLKNGSNNTNCNNKTFNINFFLNETCKNAMNIMDFVDSLQLQLNDLEKMGDIGYINGISKIIINNLKVLDITQRPLHCTDAKREILYVKDENKWDKEIETKPKLRKAIKYIAHKNCKLLQDYKKKYPDCLKSDSKHSDVYNKLLVETMGGKGDDNEEKEDKIITNISKEFKIEDKNVN